MTVLAPGTLIGRSWRLVRPLGQGGMGVVWAAEHAQLGRGAALKFLRVEFAGDEHSLRRFQQEATAAGRIGSPHIVGMLDFGTAPDGAPFLAMELLDGETLWEAMDGGAARFPPARIADVLGQALAGVGAAHACGIVHRDLKPENIFLTRLGERTDFVKLLDFGLARVRTGAVGTRLTQTGVLLGTPSYMAPEQILGAKDVDHRADLWALGVILFRCLTGQRPFDGPTPADRIAAAVSRPPPPLRSLRPELDEGLAGIVARALARRPEERFQTAEEFRSALAPYAAGCCSPYATSALAPAAIPVAGPSAGGAPTAAVAASVVPPSVAAPAPGPTVAVVSPSGLASSVPPPGFPSAPGTRPAPTCPEPAAALLRPSGRPRRLWLWAVAAVAVGLAGAGVVWLVAHGGREGPASDPALEGLSDREKFIRINLELNCPGPDGRTAAIRQAPEGYYAFFLSVAARYGLDQRGWDALANRLLVDLEVGAELVSRLRVCQAQRPPGDAGGATAAPADVSRPAADAAPEASVEQRRELYLGVMTEMMCEIARRTLAGTVADGDGVRVLREAWAVRGLTPLQYAELDREFHWDEATRAELDRRIKACQGQAATEVGIDPRAVLPPLPVPPALPPGGTGDAERDLYLLIAAELDCRMELAAAAIREPLKVRPTVEKHLLLAHQRTVDWNVELFRRVESDPTYEKLAHRLADECVTRNRAAGADAGVVEPTVPGAPAAAATPAVPSSGLPAEAAAQRALYAAIGFELGCADNADRIVGRATSEDDYRRRFAAVLAARGLTLDEWMTLNDRFADDPAATDERPMTACPPVVDTTGAVLAPDVLRRRYLDAAEASDCAAARLFRELNGNDPVRAEQVRTEALAARGLTNEQYGALGMYFVDDEPVAAEKERRRLACAER